MYSLEQVAKILNVHRNTVYNMVMREQLKAVKVGKQWRVPEEEIERIKEGKQ